MYEPEQELADLKVECENKDKTIREYEKHIDDMKSEIRELNEKYDDLEKKHSQVQEQHHKDIESMVLLGMIIALFIFHFFCRFFY